MERDTIAYRIAKVGGLSRAAAAEELAPLGVHPGQEFLLGLLWEQEGRSIGELASELGVEPPTVTKMVHRLAEARFIERRPDRDDGRVTRVHLTDEGRALESDVRAAWSRLEQRTTALLEGDGRRQLAELLDSVREALSASPTSPPGLRPT